jgi:hypothetical protein
LHFPTLQPGWSGASIAETVKEDKDKKNKRGKGEKVKRGNREKGNFAP